MNVFDMEDELTDRINENLAGDDSALEDEAMLRKVSGGLFDGTLTPPSSCFVCGSNNFVIETGNINGVEGCKCLRCSSCGYTYDVAWPD